MDVSIAIVSYNTSSLINRCITSIKKNIKDIKYEIIVVDNASTDSTVRHIKKAHKDVLLIVNTSNAYFARANNQALHYAKGRYFLVLNADTFFVDNSLKKMVNFMDTNPDVGATEGLELYENGEILKTGSLFSTPLIDFYELSLVGKRVANKKILEDYRLAKKDRRKTFDVDVGCDAFLLIRRDIMKGLNGYDERLLLYYTENDLCLRVKKKGLRIVHYGDAKLVHTVSASVSKLGWKKMDIYYHDLLMYYRKNDYVTHAYLLYLLLHSEKYLLILRGKLYDIWKK